MYTATLGDRLKVARMRRKLTQQDVADILRVDRSTVSRVETHNAIHWALFKLIQLSSVYHTSIFELLVHGSFKNIPIKAGGKIVLIDDQSSALEVYGKHLTNNVKGVEVVAFKSSVEAYDWLSKNQARLIITDYQMPIYNGGDILERANNSGRNQYTPAILMTDKSEKDVIRRVAKDESAIFFDKTEPKEIFITTVTDILKIA